MNKENKIQARLLIFDLDGTLADTISAIAEAVNMALTSLGMPTRSDEHVRASIGNGARMLCRRTLPENARDDGTIDRMLDAYEAAYAKTHIHTRFMYPGMAEAIGELHARGYVIAVLSNKQDEYVKNLCGQFFPSGLLLTAMGQRADIPIKPDPAPGLEICRLAGISPRETAMIGDGDTDIQMALAAGMTPVSVSWGFRSREQLNEAGGKIFVDSPAELITLFE